MSQPVTIENDALRVEVYPLIGGKVLSIVDKSDGYELLFDFPAEFPTTCQYDKPYGDSYCAGWDECFPAVGPGPYPTHPYKGIAIPDHGEIWSLPTHAVPSKDGITVEWNGLRFGYRLIRIISIEGPTLKAEYTLHNLAPFDFHFVWSMHALCSLHSPMELQMPGGTYRLSHDAQGKRIDAPFTWPVTGAGEDLAHPENLPAKGGWKAFSQEPISAPVIVSYPQRKRSLKIEYASDDALPAYWGLWVSSGGWGWHKHFAVEPTVGRYDELDRSTKDGSAGVVPALGKLSWRVQWTVG